MMCARQRDVDLREEESDLINLNEVTCRILEGREQGPQEMPNS